MDLPNVNQYLNTPDITGAQGAASQAAQTAANYQSAAALLPSRLKDAIQQKLDYNKDIIDAQAKAQANYFAAPATARSDYQDIFNPFDREKLVAQSVANAYAPYQSLTGILGQRQGNINDIVQAGTGAFQSSVTAAQAAAEAARQRYLDAVGLGKERYAGAQWNYEQTHKAGSGGSSGLGDLGSILQLLGQQGGQPPGQPAQSSQPKPVRRIAILNANEAMAKQAADNAEKQTGKPYGYKKGAQGQYEIWELSNAGGGQASNDPLGLFN